MTYFLTVYTKIRPLSSHKNISYPLLSYRYYKSTVMNTDSFEHAKIVKTAGAKALNCTIVSRHVQIVNTSSLCIQLRRSEKINPLK